MLYKVRVELQRIEPPIWRILHIPSRTSLLKLHRILQRAMGWTNSHLHLFEVDKQLYSEPSPDWELDVLDSRRMTLGKVFTEDRKSFIYEYDLGDSWRHKITLLDTIEGEAEEKPGCIAGARACPPEDCGGTMGYYDLLVALSDPDHEDHESLLEWVGGSYDPNAFDLAATDRAVKKAR